MPCSVSIYDPRTSRRPKANSHRSQDRAVLVSVYDPRTSRRPKPNSHRSQDPAVLVAVYDPRTSRRPKPNSHRSQDRVVLCSCLRPKHVTSVPGRTVAGPKTVSGPVSVYVRERHVGPSRTATGPKTVSGSVSVYVPRTSRRPKPNSRRSQDRVVPCFRLRPENVTSAQAEQAPVPRPYRALFPATSRARPVGQSRTATAQWGFSRIRPP